MPSRRLTRFILGAIILTCSVSAGMTAAANDRGKFFKPDSINEKPMRAHFRKSARTELDATALTRPTIDVDLFGEQVSAIRDRVEHRADGSLSWIGHVSGSKGERVILTARNGAFAGRIEYGGKVFEISNSRAGAMMISELDPAALPAEEPFYLPHSPDGGPGFFKGKPAGAAAAKATAGAPVQQDILVAYTDDACRNAGGDGVNNCSQVEARIVNAVADMNDAYTASDVNITMNLVAMVQTDYDESGKSASEMLSELRDPNDGQIDDVHDARDAYGADLVALVTGAGGGFCGIAYVSASASYAMSVTAESCLLNRTLAHEVGHNQGASHARSQEDGGVSGAYYYGYRRCNDGSMDDVGAPYFSTIMAYGCSGATRIGNFSNPNVNYSGTPTGIDPADDPDNAAWAARTLNESASQIAGFRESVNPPDPVDPPAAQPPAAPSGLSAVAGSTSTIVLTWNDNAANENEFHLQRALGAGAFSLIATLAANVTMFSDNGLVAGSTYRYRVRASNSDGASAWSNIAEATTLADPTTTDDKALGDVAQAEGRVEGDYTDTFEDDGIVQRLTEVSVGNRSINHQYRGFHVWRFDILGGGGVTFETNAYVSGREGFRFDYRRAGERVWRQMFVVNSNEPGNIERFGFPAYLSGEIYVRARDAYLGKNETADTLSVDYMAATTDLSTDQSGAGNAPLLVFTPNGNEFARKSLIRAPYISSKRPNGFTPLDFKIAPLDPSAAADLDSLPANTEYEQIWRGRYANFRTRLRD